MSAPEGVISRKGGGGIAIRRYSWMTVGLGGALGAAGCRGSSAVRSRCERGSSSMQLLSRFAAVLPLVGVTVGMAAPGADIITGDVPNISKYGIINVGGEDWTGYSMGTTSCNVGTAGSPPEPWVSNTNQHPLIAQNMYRLRTVGGAPRFEQIGASWLKHASITINNGICGTCTGPTGSQLYVGCSDPYGSGLNGSQSSLGPRSEVNPYTGAFPYPYLTAWNQTGNAIFKRVQVRNNDVNPAMNSGARYFGEGQYISNNEAMLGNGFNNSSYRELLVGANSSTGWALTFTGSTQRQKPGIVAWKDVDPSVTLQEVFIPGEGLVYVGGQATDLGGGQWRYEYAVYNHNSHRSVGSFGVPVATIVNVSNIGFHDVDCHSGEPYTNTDWPGVESASEVSWATTPYDPAFVPPANVPAKQGGYANAIRWGTLYNFRFDANVAPTTGTVTLGLWRPGTPNSVVATMPVPQVPPPPSCPGDTNGDNVVDAADLSVLLANFGGVAAGPSTGNFNDDSQCDSADLSVLLAQFGISC